MSMLAELVEVVIGVDTHKHTHTAAVVAASTGAVLAHRTVRADPDGYAELSAFAEQHSGLRAWAMEGSGGYGAGLAEHLAQHEEMVIELDRPVRPKRRAGPSPIRSTPCAPLETRWPAPTWPSPRAVPSGPRCRCT
jgi:transposase